MNNLSDLLLTGGENKRRRDSLVADYEVGAKAGGTAAGAGIAARSMIGATISDGVLPALPTIAKAAYGPPGKADRDLAMTGEFAGNVGTFARALITGEAAPPPPVVAPPLTNAATLRSLVKPEAAPSAPTVVQADGAPQSTAGVTPASRLVMIRNGTVHDRLRELIKPITETSATNFQSASSPLGGLLGATIALGGINMQNKLRNNELKSLVADQQRGDKTALDQFTANTQAQSAAAQADTAARTGEAQANLANVRADQEKVDTKSKMQLADLQAKLIAETDEKKKEVLRLKIADLQGKFQDKISVIDYDTGEEDIAGNPLFKKGAINTRTGELVASPNAMSLDGIPMKAIRMLKSNPKLRGDFDTKYGSGRAAKYLDK